MKDKEMVTLWLNRISQTTFYLALFIELTIVILDKSAYIIQYEGLWFRFTFLLFGISLITVKHHPKEWLWFVIFAGIGVISYKATGRNEILRWVVFIWSCQGKDMKKVFKYTFWYTTAGCVVLFLLSVLGIYGTVAQEAVYRAESELRYCFGMGHPNAFHCMMLAITWLGIYCYYEKLRWYSYALIVIGHVVVYVFTKSRTGLLMAMGSILVAIVLIYWKRIQGKKWPYLLGIAVIVGGVVLSVLMAKYNTTLPIFEKIDSYMTGRIYSLYDSDRDEGMLHTWRLWSEPRNNYFFDLGIVRMFYWFGVIPASIYFLVQCWMLWCGYKKKDYMLLMMVTVITIYTIFEAHYVSDYIGRNYLFFFLGMYLKEMLGVDDEKQTSVI